LHPKVFVPNWGLPQFVAVVHKDFIICAQCYRTF
jgi:hypothetical protein